MDKLCPFRKETIFMDNNGEETFAIQQSEAVFSREYFMECIGDSCMMWNRTFQTCGINHTIG